MWVGGALIPELKRNETGGEENKLPTRIFVSASSTKEPPDLLRRETEVVKGPVVVAMTREAGPRQSLNLFYSPSFEGPQRKAWGLDWLLA